MDCARHSAKGSSSFPAPSPNLQNPKRFAAFVDSLFKQTGSYTPSRHSAAPALVLRYLGRYTHRVAISNHRLLTFDGEHVTFRWKDYAHGNKQKKMTLAATEFLRRFTQHILPRGFVRIRQFGFLTNTRRSILLALARKLLPHHRSPTKLCPPALANAPLGVARTAMAKCGWGRTSPRRQLAAQCRPLDSS